MTNSAGKFEADKKILSKRAKEKKSEIQTIDLKDFIPDYLSSNKIPRGIRRNVSNTFDNFLEKTGGLYTFTKGTKLQIYFEGVSGALAKNKAKVLGSKLRDAIKSKNTNDPLADSAAAEAAAQQAAAEKKKSEEPSALARVIKEGLPENPDERTLMAWTQRVLQDTLHQPEGQFLPNMTLSMVAAAN